MLRQVFFELAREYADGHSPKLDFAKSLSVVERSAMRQGNVRGPFTLAI